MTDSNGNQCREGSELAIPTPSETIHSCSFCYLQEIDPGLTLRDGFWSGTAVQYRASRVLDGSSSGCLFFKDTLHSLEAILSAYGYEQGSASGNFRPENWVYRLSFSVTNGCLELGGGRWICAKGELPESTQHPKQEGVNYLALAYRGTGRKYVLLLEPRLTRTNAEVDDPSAESIPIRPYLHDFKGAESASWARRRIEECEHLHQDCKAADTSLLPMRLLKIDSASDGIGTTIRLHSTESSEIEVLGGKYATLSYCWGGGQEFQLNADSEDMLMRGISTSLLPDTLRDAVQVTWDLEIRWIWIDSLCIRQDDQEEKATEVARMHSIYGNSYITISAARAKSCRQGFLYQCSLPAPATTGYKLPFASPSGRLGSVILSRSGVTSPIDERGWTLQEHVLARRVLRFTDFQLHWSCGVTSEFEERDTGTLPGVHVRRLERAYEMYKGIRDDSRHCRHWMNVVEEYTKRELTNGFDKLPAISGIAEYWARTSKDEYLAGIWRSQLPLSLLWTSAQPFRQDEFEAYRAPSWSWASLVGQIDWFDHLFTEVDLALKVETCTIDLAHPQAQYGAVKSGVLIVYGRLQETILDEVSSVPALDNEEHGYLDLTLADVHLDFWDEALASKVDGAKLFCLQFCCFDATTSMGPSGLILATKDGTAFSRIGLFTFEPPQKDEVEDLGDFDALLELSEGRQLVQRSAFQHISPRRIAIF